VSDLLVLDAGNTQVTIGVWRGEALSGPWRLATIHERTADEYGILVGGLLEHAGIAPRDLEGVALCCVVPPLLAPLTEMARGRLALEALVVEPGVRTGISIQTDHPLEVGADRIVNAVAAFGRHGGPALVVDFGTATTVDAVSARGEYLGGAIAPGVGIASEALFARASRLPRVEIRRPRQVIGRNTVAAIQSGLVHGYASLIDGLVRRMASELAPPDGSGVRVIATGGLAPAIAGECVTLERIEPDLTLDGLRRVWERNRTSRTR
jgi:type III pantothenate kinase